MPPPSYTSKISTRSNYDHERETDAENGRSEVTNSCDAYADREGRNIKREAVGIVKTLLGPSLEDAVLRTLEFGKSLMQKSDDHDYASKCKKFGRTGKKEDSKYRGHHGSPEHLHVLLEERSSAERKENKLHEGSSKQCSIGKLEKKSKSPSKKVSKVSKIRSLDSDLKRDSSSPEKIKRQLQALIQINKDEPPEHICNPILSKTPKLPVEITVMPTMCDYRNETDLNCTTSRTSRGGGGGGGCGGGGGGGGVCVGGGGGHDYDAGTSRTRPVKKRLNKMRHAPEFLSNALGPTIDVSIIDNLKMMRDILNYDSGKGEGPHKKPAITQGVGHEVRLQNSEAEMTARIEELQRKIEELETKEQCLAKQIEEEEREREERRRAFKEEEKRMLTPKKSSLQRLVVDTKKDDLAKVSIETGKDTKFEGLQARVACEEEKLARVKAQIESCKKELAGIKHQKETMRKNKCLLEAWDVFASRVCHTRLPSFSRTLELDRKQYKSYDSTIHCCFPNLISAKVGSRQASRTDVSRNASRNTSRCGSRNQSKESLCQISSKTRCKIQSGEVQFPIQRDIHCGLHQLMKTCCCSSRQLGGPGASVVSSEEDLLKKIGGREKLSSFTSANLESPSWKRGSERKISRSRSDTTLRRDRNTRIVKVLWAITRINIFQNNCRTYEIMDATSSPPPSAPVKTEGIFVVKTPQKKMSRSPSRRKHSTGY